MFGSSGKLLKSLSKDYDSVTLCVLISCINMLKLDVMLQILNTLYYTNTTFLFQQAYTPAHRVQVSIYTALKMISGNVSLFTKL